MNKKSKDKNERSLGLSVVFAGCDLASFKKTSKFESESILANSNIKIKLKNNK